MRHDHLKRELDLLLMLTQNRSYTVEQICSKLGISRRSLYYFFDFLRFAGFTVEKYGSYYSVSRDSAFFHKLLELIQFTDDEAILIRNLIEAKEMKTMRERALLQKLEKFYDFKIYEDEKLHARTMHCMQRIHDAIKMHRMVKIVGYSSPSSHSVKDRIVEPFLFFNNNMDVRCYELSSGKNKTFRVSRMQDVEVLYDDWAHEKEHRKVFTDLFMFSGDVRMEITLILGQLSHNLMLEEYPDSVSGMTEQTDGRWLFRTEVCSYLGIGRFVLGLYDDVEVLGDDGFKSYVAGKIQNWAGKEKSEQ